MKPAPFSYHAPRSVRDAVELTAANAESARVLAGGQSLMPLLNMRRVRTDHVIDINGIAEMEAVRRDNGSLVLGALVRQSGALTDPRVDSDAPLLAEALRRVGNPTVRNRGTVCGSLAFAQPSAEIPTVALAMGGEVMAAEAGGERSIAIEELFTAPFATALRTNEIMTEVRVRRWSPKAGHAFVEVDRLRAPVVVAAVMVELDGNAISRCSVALGGVGETPIRVRAVEEGLMGTPPTEESFRAAGTIARDSLDPPADIHGTAAYRRSVAGVLVRRAAGIAVGRARSAAS